MKELERLYKNNLEWATRINTEKPNFFADLSKQQSPDYLWIGCSDSRVVSEQLVGLQPGELFVHRNIANVVVHTDLNCLAVIQYAVEVLKVKHIIVCGHYGCGGVLASMQTVEHGLIDNWLCHIKNVHLKYQEELDALTDETVRLNRLCELNVIEQVKNICHTTMVQRAWRNSKALSVHGCIYTLETGLLKDLGVRYSHMHDLNSIFQLKEAKKAVYEPNLKVMETDYEGR